MKPRNENGVGLQNVPGNEGGGGRGFKGGKR